MSKKSYVGRKDKPIIWPMKFPIFQVDAFTSKVFGGNPAAVVPLTTWLPDEQLQEIAMEKNLSETAFFVQNNETFDLRWFTPQVEVDLCGHATLATAHVLFEELGYAGHILKFHTKSGPLTVIKKDGELVMDFPSAEIEQVEAPPILFQALGIIRTAQTFKSDDYLVVLETQEEVENIQPDFRLLKEVNARGIIVSAPGKEVDFVSRFFAPQVGIDEDPVTGSAHTTLAPYWAERLGKETMQAQQISKRKGALTVYFKGERTELSGRAVTYLIGEMNI